ncbi:hypothetical protein CcI49_02920 [Frankia sp. CcI49]|nr:Clp protease N-terminal domain-containing protein [Frankia sp. CcI49]ONH62347.1 hypothetical protein CcI49_02920 [Frankia sp. CcI49]
MFELFTGRARRVVVLAHEEAVRLPHPHIGTEHILLALIREGESLAIKALAALGASGDAIRSRVEDSIGTGDQPPHGHIPFTKGAKTALEHSLHESQRLGHDVVGPEHILLGLISANDGLAGRVLAEIGADLTRTREEVSRLAAAAGPASGDDLAAIETIERRRPVPQSRADENDTLQSEVQRLRALLRAHGIDPDSEPPPT